MSLTRITSGVVSANAISTEKLANGSIGSRQLANTSVELNIYHLQLIRLLQLLLSLLILTANLVQITANINQFNQTLMLTATNVNIVSSNVGNTTAFTANVEARRTANIAGAISTVLTSDLTASRALVSGSGGKIEVVQPHLHN